MLHGKKKKNQRRNFLVKNACDKQSEERQTALKPN